MARGARIVGPAVAAGLVPGTRSMGEGVDLAGAGEVDTDDHLRVATAGEPDPLDPSRHQRLLLLPHPRERPRHAGPARRQPRRGARWAAVCWRCTWAGARPTRPPLEQR